MKNIMDKLKIIMQKLDNKSDRVVAIALGCNRKTVRKYWNAYLKEQENLKNSNGDIKEFQEKITEKPKYSTGNRRKRKFTGEMRARLKEILESEVKKDKILGSSHKQGLTKKQIHEMLISERFDISISTISNEINNIRNSHKEVFIRQEYEYADRLEYDFGEVKLVIDDVLITCHMAVLSSPGGNFRWAYLYTNQKKDVFMDSHVKFFDMLGGVYKEVVYDNMKNVVSRFVGKNQKELNEDLIKMSIYYGFQINVTNCFSGNEKGYVESSVKILRNQIFAINYQFNSLNEAKKYMKSCLLKLNENSKIEEEKLHLLPYKPKLEIATISENEVNSYSFIHVDNNFYSVPEYLVGKKVSVKKYYNEICVYSNNYKVCTHSRIFGNKQMQVDIYHYLKTFLKKPGAIKNSLALKSTPALKQIYDAHYVKMPKKFIEVLMENKELSIDQMLKLFEEKIKNTGEMLAIDVINAPSKIDMATKKQLSNYSSIYVMGGVRA